MPGSVIGSISIAVQASGRAIVTLFGHRSDDMLDMAEVYGSVEGELWMLNREGGHGKRCHVTWIAAKRANEKSSRSSLGRALLTSQAALSQKFMPCRSGTNIT